MATKSTSKTAEIGFDSVSAEAFQDLAARAFEANKENLEAVVQSVTVTSKALAALGNENLAFAKTTLEESGKAAKALLSAKTAQDFFTLQTEYARSAFDQFVNQAAKINDLTQTLAKDAYAPLNGRFTELADVVHKARAA